MAMDDDETIGRLSERYAISTSGVRAVLVALRAGRGMAQFSHPDFGGMSQWSPGMTMVGDMFNADLKSKLDGLCTDLSAYLAETPDAQPRPDNSSRVSYTSQASSGDWWPQGLGVPGAVGAQNHVRYAIFPASRRLVIDDHGQTVIYDTGDHRIHGVAQAQSSERTLTFTSQNGLVSIADLPKVSA